MDQPEPRYINRELSWLEFNQRVLDEAGDPDVPLLERLRFIAITASNLDEFFKVRVGGLQLLVADGSTRRDPSGMTPAEQLAAISVRAHRMMADQYAALDDVSAALAEHGIRRLKADQLGDGQRGYAARYFEDRILPVATPMAIEEASDFPLLTCGTISLLVTLEPAEAGTERRHAVIPLGRGVPRIIMLPGEGRAFIMLEDVASAFVGAYFPGERVEACAAFRITRNADLGVREDMASDLLTEMEHVLDARKESGCVRLEIAAEASADQRDALREALDVRADDVYHCPGPIDLTTFSEVAGLEGFDALRFEQWPAQPHPGVDPRETMFNVLGARNVLLSHPFESFEPVLRLLSEAADDPEVIAIKQVLYRTSRQSPVVAALRRAALNGKNVTVVVELKARFDEARNIEWARDLELAGAQVIYGVKGFKIHAKVCLIVRREAGGIRRYVHYGTGNYNEVTARLYTDVSYLSCDDDLGADATTFFNAVNGYSEKHDFRRIRIAPIGLRDQLLTLIHAEAERCRQGRPARIMMKMNSLADPAIIDALYDASQAGVRVDLNVRGICCLRPGVPGLSENISVVSIIDRFLEHSRIYWFLHGGEAQVLIASADCMPRNLDRRLEILTPVDDEAAADRLTAVLEACFADERKGRRIDADGGYAPPPAAASGEAPGSQRVLYEAACRAAREAKKRENLIFEPHRSPEAEAGDTETSRADAS